MSHSAPAGRTSGRWMFALIGAVVIVVVAIGAFSLMSGMRKSPPQAVPTASPSPSVPAVAPEPSETATAPEPQGFSASDALAVETAISSGTPADTFDYLADPVTVAFAASDFNQERSPALAISDLGQVSNGTGWSWELDPETLDTYRDGPYGNYFSDDSLVGESAEGYVVTLHVGDDAIDEIFISKTHRALTVRG